jgi:hypothetical protein
MVEPAFFQATGARQDTHLIRGTARQQSAASSSGISSIGQVATHESNAKGKARVVAVAEEHCREVRGGRQRGEGEDRWLCSCSYLKQSN